MRLIGVRGPLNVETVVRLATVLDAPFEPSPYSPASRLFWSDLFIDTESVPGSNAAEAGHAAIETGGSDDLVVPPGTRLRFRDVRIDADGNPTGPVRLVSTQVPVTLFGYPARLEGPGGGLWLDVVDGRGVVRGDLVLLLEDVLAQVNDTEWPDERVPMAEAVERGVQLVAPVVRFRLVQPNNTGVNAIPLLDLSGFTFDLEGRRRLWGLSLDVTRLSLGGTGLRFDGRFDVAGVAGGVGFENLRVTPRLEVDAAGLRIPRPFTLEADGFRVTGRNIRLSGSSLLVATNALLLKRLRLPQQESAAG